MANISKNLILPIKEHHSLLTDFHFLGSPPIYRLYPQLMNLCNYTCTVLLALLRNLIQNERLKNFIVLPLSLNNSIRSYTYVTKFLYLLVSAHERYVPRAFFQLIN